jgi:hypothetical protein
MIMCGGGTKKSAPIRKRLNHLCNNSLLLITYGIAFGAIRTKEWK